MKVSPAPLYLVFLVRSAAAAVQIHGTTLPPTFQRSSDSRWDNLASRISNIIYFCKFQCPPGVRCPTLSPCPAAPSAALLR